MKTLCIIAAVLATALSHAVVIGPIGGEEPVSPVSVTVYASELVAFTGTVVNDANEVSIKIETPGEEAVATLTAVPDASGNFSVNWFPPVDATFTVTAVSYLDGVELSSQTVAIISAVRPDANGHITGGGWYMTGSSKDTMGFVAQVLGNGSVRGSFEFQDHANLMNFKSTSVDWVYAPDCSEGYFSGFCKLNGSGNYRFFVRVFDNGEPGSNDNVQFEVYNPTTGALVFSYSQTLSHGNVKIHCK